MKFVSNMVISLKRNITEEIISLAFKTNCDIKSFHNNNMNNRRTLFLEVFYENSTDIKNFINRVRLNKDSVESLELKSELEDKIKDGILTVHGKLPIDKDEDYEVNINGVKKYFSDKIKRLPESEPLKGNYKDSAFITGFPGNGEIKEKYVYESHILNQFDSIVYNRFTGKNAFPMVLSYDQSEVFVQALQSLTYGFSSFRISESSDYYDYSLYEEILNSINKPVLFKNFDERAIFIFAAILKLLKKGKANLKNSTIGFIGIDSAVIRLADILSALGCMRALGYDHNEKNMMHFERRGGLATTRENIYSNSDIIVFYKNNIDDEGLDKLRPGLSIITIDRLACEDTIKSSRLCRDYISGDWYDHSLIFPAMVKNMERKKISSINNSLVVSLADKLCKSTKDNEYFADMKQSFGSIITASFNEVYK